MSRNSPNASHRLQASATAAGRDRALLIGVDSDAAGDAWSLDDSLDELAHLVATAGADVVARVTQRLHEPQMTSYVGKGKLEEIRAAVLAHEVTMVVADDELKPAQQRHLEEQLDVQVLDRTAIILDIFAQRARSREGALQVELAQLQYRLPRLQGSGASLSRLGGGIGARGPGETALESDRRRIRGRISHLRADLATVRRQRAVQRRWRGRQGVPVIALVGYTNAGKSTLLNHLTRSEVLAENRLFATLDPTTRTLVLPHRQQALVTDTVGFIQKLPTDLVEAFKATLEEVAEADLLLHVVDISNPHALAQALTVYNVLQQIGAGDKRVVTALNKVDRASDDVVIDHLADFPNPVPISAEHGVNLDLLAQTIAAVLAADFKPMEVVLPLEARELLDLYHLRGVIDDESYGSDGARIRGRVPPDLEPAFRSYRVR